ncbi:hypothetical protein A2841_03550 [Candidatus Kaiserbacteria bacterium RIFCSPHIGHO2_01_FULL_48_10]|uniref:SpoVT-AbrB domain-containing protein n=1 Tax=Candidatus Kaiserbacteria bacterium RIFCSPHIGHO2_01_FULL_48_10 TaxID=1798476 RepID=A0A1F6C1Y3_9BACT|nr:MAG: hypothetical protein A2841_03550 [Candidatus Kaiserbacteria bacterium RIFCSPHIGHO2_01_FULL_48_10]
MAGRRKVGKENIRSLSKVSSGKSYAITLPKDLLRALGWKERQKLIVSVKRKRLIVRDWKK